MKVLRRAAARKVAGVLDVVQVPTGVAVIARDTWSAMKGREALTVDLGRQHAETRSSDAILAEYRERRQGPGASRRPSAATPQAALRAPPRSIEAEFDFPFLAHAPMEPLNATIERAADGGYDVCAGLPVPDRRPDHRGGDPRG